MLSKAVSAKHDHQTASFLAAKLHQLTKDCGCGVLHSAFSHSWRWVKVFKCFTAGLELVNSLSCNGCSCVFVPLRVTFNTKLQSFTYHSSLVLSTLRRFDIETYTITQIHIAFPLADQSLLDSYSFNRDSSHWVTLRNRHFLFPTKLPAQTVLA